MKINPVAAIGLVIVAVLILGVAIFKTMRTSAPPDNLIPTPPPGAAVNPPNKAVMPKGARKAPTDAPTGGQ